MSSPVPEFADPWHWADLGKRIHGRVPLAEMPRLAAALVRCDGEAEFELGFHRDPHRRARIDGWIRALLTLECQRCLGPMAFAVERAVSLAVVEGLAEMEALPEDQEPLLMESARVALKELIEDELLIELPQVARHAEGACVTQLEKPAPAAEAEAPSVRKNPFAQLAALKDKDNL